MDNYLRDIKNYKTLFNGYALVDYFSFIDNGVYIQSFIESVQDANSSLLERIIFEELRKNMHIFKETH